MHVHGHTNQCQACSCAACCAHRFRTDSLLGIASVPLEPLLHDCWVDGYAPVHAVMAVPGPAGKLVEERVQVRLHKYLTCSCCSRCWRHNSVGTA